MPTIDPDVFWRWNSNIAKLIATSESSNAPQNLMEALRQLMPFDIGMIVIYSKNSKPINVFDNADNTLRVQNIDAYLEGAFLLDPYYRAGINKIKPGLYSLNEVAPSGFKQSEYFTKYYKSSLIEDEVGFISYLADDFFINTSFVNVKGSSKFKKSNVNKLRASQPVIEATLDKYWSSNKETSENSESLLHSQLESALGVFGNSVLTNRECEIIRMYLHGHNTTSISDRLGISNHTVSYHRKNAYLKLDINSQAELFHLFIDSLSLIDDELKQDPLRYYLKHQN